MDTEQGESRETVPPYGGAEFAWRGLALWLPACLMVGLLVGWAAITVQTDLGFAPLLLFPILTGLVLGAAGVGLMRVCQVGNRPTILLGIVLAAAVAVAVEHYVGYRAARQDIQDNARKFQTAKAAFADQLKDRIPAPPDGLIDFLDQQAARGRPLLGEYVARGVAAWLSWVVDGLLILVSAEVLAVWAVRQPYCSRCRSWYRTTRSGRISTATARQLAELAAVSIPEGPQSARYRFLTCNRGCSPTGFELSWDEPHEGTSSVRVWLDHGGRAQATRILDEPDVDD